MRINSFELGESSEKIQPKEKGYDEYTCPRCGLKMRIPFTVVYVKEKKDE